MIQIVIYLNLPDEIDFRPMADEADDRATASVLTKPACATRSVYVVRHEHGNVVVDHLLHLRVTPSTH